MCSRPNPSHTMSSPTPAPTPTTHLIAITDDLRSIQRQIAELTRQAAALEAEKKRAEYALAAQYPELTAEEILELRRAITVLVEVTKGPHVAATHIYLCTSPSADEHSPKWSIDMTCEFVKEWDNFGLVYRVSIRTWCASVRAYVQSMLRTMTPYDDDFPQESWSSDEHITVVNPISADEYARCAQRGRC